jgi:hypothetical protein
LDKKFEETHDKVDQLYARVFEKPVKDTSDDFDVPPIVGKGNLTSPPTVSVEEEGSQVQKGMESVLDLVTKTLSSGMGSVLGVHEGKSTSLTLHDLRPPGAYQFTEELHLDSRVLVQEFGDLGENLGSHFPALDGSYPFGKVLCPKCSRLLGVLSLRGREVVSSSDTLRIGRQDKDFFE